MKLLTLCVAIVAALVVVAASPAAKSGPGTGVIDLNDVVFCGFGGRTSDGEFVYAGGAAGWVDFSFKSLGGTSLSDPYVGWICEGTTFFTGQLPSIGGALVITGLTCTMTFPHGGPLGRLAAPGTAILYPEGRARLICPVSEVEPFS